MIITKPYDKKKFLADKPTLIGIVNTIHFYEHPKRGDESPLIAINGEECGLTDFWELPTIEELNLRG